MGGRWSRLRGVQKAAGSCWGLFLGKGRRHRAIVIKGVFAQKRFL